MERNTTIAANLSDEIKLILYKISISNPEFDELRPVFLALAIFMSVTTILGNALVLLLFYQERRSLKVAHKYIISMAVCDLCMGLISVPSQIFLVHQRINAGSVYCPRILSTLTALVQTSLTVLVVASIDRYWAVRFPHHYRLKAKDWVANCIIVVSWIIPCSFGLITFLTAHPAVNLDLVCIMGTEMYNPIMLDFLIYGVMPFNLTVIVILYLLIHREMTKLFNSNGFYAQVFNVIFQKQDSIKAVGTIKIRELRTTLLLLITVALALITFLPGLVIGYVMTSYPHLLEVKSFLILFLLFAVNSVFNPFIYAFNIQNVREAARRLMLRVIYCKEAEDPEIGTISSSGPESIATKSSLDKILSLNDESMKKKRNGFYFV